MHTATIAPEALATLRTMPHLLRRLLGAMPETTLTRANPEGWSIKDVVAHLHDTEQIAFVMRIRRMLDQETPFIQSIDPPARLLAGGYAARTLPDLLDDLEAQRAEHVTWLLTLTPAQLARGGTHDVAGTIHVCDVIHQWAYHDLAHIRQIMEMLQAALVPYMGATRAFYPEAEALRGWSH